VSGSRGRWQVVEPSTVRREPRCPCAPPSRSGSLGTALAVLLVGVLHVIDGDRVDPVRRTISEYALRDHGWMFDLGVLALAAGSVAVLVALALWAVCRAPAARREARERDFAAPEPR